MWSVSLLTGMRVDVPKKPEIAERIEAIMFVREANELSSWGVRGAAPENFEIFQYNILKLGDSGALSDDQSDCDRLIEPWENEDKIALKFSVTGGSLLSW